MKIVDFREAQDKLIENKPHEVAELICLKCLHRYIGVYPQKTYLKDLECETCGKGFIIKTGQAVEDEYGEFL